MWQGCARLKDIHFQTISYASFPLVESAQPTTTAHTRTAAIDTNLNIDNQRENVEIPKVDITLKILFGEKCRFLQNRYLLVTVLSKY